MTPHITLITGASRGLGAATAEVLAGPATHIIALARTTGALEELDDRIKAKGGLSTLVPLDIKDEAAVKRLCISINERWGGLDLWVHTIVHAAPLSPANHADQKDWDNSFDTNVRMAQQLIANLDPLLETRNGTAVHCIDPRAGKKFFAAYGASKAAQRALFESWSAEVAPRGRKVIGFEPRPMISATRARFFPGEPRESLFSCAVEAKRLKSLLQS